jgi:thioredoxin-dependent peroxiredoxin
MAAKKKSAEPQTVTKATTKKAGLEPESLVGTKAPAFKLRDQNDEEFSSSRLAKKPYLLYFYPKDNTPGCTTESCDFRDEMANFRALGVTVLGVSPDSTKSHAGFAAKHELPFTLLSDPEHELAEAYGVWALKKNYGREYWGIVRSTFLIGADGKVKGHVAAVLEASRV